MLLSYHPFRCMYLQSPIRPWRFLQALTVPPRGVRTNPKPVRISPFSSTSPRGVNGFDNPIHNPAYHRGLSHMPLPLSHIRPNVHNFGPTETVLLPSGIRRLVSLQLCHTTRQPDCIHSFRHISALEALMLPRQYRPGCLSGRRKQAH